MRRGEIRWLEFQSPDKRHPVLILTRDSILPYLNQITVVPIATTIRGVASEMRLDIQDGMPQECVANFHHLQTVPKQQVGQLITTLSTKKMKDVGPALCFR